MKFRDTFFSNMLRTVYEASKDEVQYFDITKHRQPQFAAISCILNSDEFIDFVHKQGLKKVKSSTFTFITFIERVDRFDKPVEEAIYCHTNDKNSRYIYDCLAQSTFDTRSNNTSVFDGQQLKKLGQDFGLVDLKYYYNIHWENYVPDSVSTWSKDAHSSYTRTHSFYVTFR